MIKKLLDHKIKILSSFILCGLVCFCFIVSTHITQEITPDDTPLSESNTEAMFYVENPESGSVTCIGDGLIKSVDEITNDKTQTAEAVVTAPDYSAIIGNQLTIAWHTITHEDGEYKVYGTITTASAEKAEESITTLTVSTFYDLQSAKVAEDGTITTLGFYEENDGGGAEYIVSSTPSSTNIINASVEIAGGLYANLIFTDSINVKQIGAKGDGNNDDFGYFDSIVSAGIGVTVPAGTYEMNNRNLTLPSSLTLSGTEDSRPTLSRTTIVAPYGVTLRNLTLDGGNKQALYLQGRANNIGNFLVLVNPESSSSVNYENCTFQNADFGSFAMVDDSEKSKYFTSDKATGCTFKNLRFIGVYHCLNSNLSEYRNNTFEDIGDYDVTSGTIAALKIGDTTNVTTMGSKKCIIANNIFRNLYSGDDLTRERHSLNCNFITVFGDNAEITANKISNLYGYGEDRESIYTKVRYCTISNNYITNGGFGEGYICNKGYAANDALCTITNNTFVGDYGAGIQNYGAAVIKNNNIQIKHISKGIGAYGRTDNLINDLVIESNTITASTAYYYIDSERITTFSPTYVIQTERYLTPVVINNNTIDITSEDDSAMKSVIRVGQLKGDFEISENEVDCDVSKCTGVEISGNQDSEKYHKDGEYDIIDNDFNVADTPISISIKGSDSNTDRAFTIQDNDIACSKTLGYCILVSVNKENNDSLVLDNNTVDANYTKKVLYSNVKTVQQ